MAVTYRNTRTGRLVDLDEGDSRIPELDRGTRWERVGAAVRLVPVGSSGFNIETDQPPETKTDEPSAADVRAWAREHDIDVPSMGRLPAALVEQYKAATG